MRKIKWKPKKSEGVRMAKASQEDIANMYEFKEALEVNLYFSDSDILKVIENYSDDFLCSFGRVVFGYEILLENCAHKDKDVLALNHKLQIGLYKLRVKPFRGKS